MYSIGLITMRSFSPYIIGLSYQLVQDRIQMKWSRLAAVCASASLVAFVLWLCGRGFEFTDEGFYLNSIAYPWAQERAHLLFGFAFHPVYLLAAGDVATLRYVNVAMLWLCASVAFFAVLNELPPKTHLLHRLALSAALGVTSFNLFLLWLPTPSYNALALSGLLLATAGAVICRGSHSFSAGPVCPSSEHLAQMAA